MFISIDDYGRINAYNPNDLSGNTGWVETEETIEEPLFEEHGVPIYKYVDGAVVHRTQEEIDADIPAPSDEVSAEEALSTLLGGML